MSNPTQEGYDALCFSVKEDEVKRLQAENARLRAALQAIADAKEGSCPDEDGGYGCSQCEEKSDLARAALAASAAAADASPS